MRKYTCSTGISYGCLKVESYSIEISQTRDNNTREHLPSDRSMLDSGLSVLHASFWSVLSSLLGGLRNPILTRARMEDHSISAWRLAEGASVVRGKFSVSPPKCTLPHRYE